MRRFVLALVLVALSVVLVAPAADAHFGRPDKHRPPHRSASVCSVINRAEDIFATDPARVDRTVRDHVKRFYLAGNLVGYWAEVSTCADANLLPIVQAWILYYDPLFVF